MRERGEGVERGLRARLLAYLDAELAKANAATPGPWTFNGELYRQYTQMALSKTQRRFLALYAEGL